jgi:uncharacterized protein with NRDE domain
MCLLVAAYRLHPEFPLIVAANRDEFFHRPTAPAHYWDNDSGILAGRDLEHGGTWMGVSKTGRFAALTNVRDPKAFRADAKSRGLIVSNFLASKKTPAEFLMRLASECGDYNGFNLILGGEKPLFYFNSVTKKTIALAPGIYGLSNDQLDTPWPKVTRAKVGLAQSLSKESTALETTLFDLLRDNTKAADSELPDTGVGIEKERWLSPIFIRAKEYGTRCSTLLLTRRDGEVQYIERTFDTASDAVSVSRHVFRTLDQAII